MKNTINMFDQFPVLSEDAKTAFEKELNSISVDKGELLEQEGQVCDHLYFIIEGSARSFYRKENKDITVSFSLEGEFLTAMHSFISRKPSYENIEAMEKTKVARIKYRSLLKLFEKHHDLERTYRLILEQYFVSLEEKLIFTKFKSARDRYLDLMEYRPKVIQRASVGQIATYLDMSIETLSRIRGKI
jgi:CRP-like cAMP-binding protein